MIDALYRASLLAWLRTLPATRNPIGYVLVFLYPAFFVLLYTIVGGAHMTSHVLIAIPVVYLFNIGVVSLSQSAWDYRNRRIKDMFVASPVSPLTYVIGLGLSRLIYVAPVLSIWAGTVLVMGAFTPLQVAVASTILIATWLTGCAIGFALVGYISEVATMSAASNLAGLILTILPPVLYPVDLLQPPLNSLLLILPSVSAAHLMRIIAGMTEYAGGQQVVLCIGVIAGWTAICGATAAYIGRWRET